MKVWRPILVALLFFVISRGAHAEVFQYFDEEGTLIVTDDPYGIKKNARHQQRIDRNRDVRINFKQDVSYEFYAVPGKSMHDAIAAMDSLGPYDTRENRRYAGQTRWNYGLSYNIDFSYRIDDGLVLASVQIRDIEFRPDITVILPALSEKREFIPDDLRAWEGLEQALAEHEHDHVRIIQESHFRQEVISGLSAIREITLPAQPDEHAEEMAKRAIESKVRNVAYPIMRKIKQKNDEYDNLTDHGRKPELRNAFFLGL